MSVGKSSNFFMKILTHYRVSTALSKADTATKGSLIIFVYSEPDKSKVQTIFKIGILLIRACQGNN